jgi:putative transposase
LVDRAEAWPWGSLARLVESSPAPPGPALGDWPIERPPDWLERVNAAMSHAEEEALRSCVRRGQPFGSPEWGAVTASHLGLESSFRPRGRPRKQQNGS